MSAFRFVRRSRRPAAAPSRVTVAAPRVERLEDRTNPGPLTFAAQPQFTSQFTFGGEIVRTGDINGDGLLDYVAANSNPSSGPQLEIGINNGFTPFTGQMTFSRAVALTVPDGGLANLSLAVGDFVGGGMTGGPDGFADIAVGTTSNDSLIIFRSNGDGSFQAPAKVSFGPSFSFFGEITGLAAGDLNNDGQADLLLARSDQDAAGTPREYTAFLNNGQGGFTAAQRSGKSGFGSLRNPRLVDVDADGNLDVVAYDGGAFPSPAVTSSVAVFWGKGDGTFDNATVVGVSGTSLSSVNAGDFNGDGKKDLAVGYSNSTAVDVFYQSPTKARAFPGFLTTSVTLAGNFSPRTTDIGVGDLDFDGDDDMVVGMGFFGKTSVFLGSAKNILTVASGSPFNTQAAVGVAVADFDGNVLPDFFTVGWPENKNQLFLNKTVVGGDVTLADSSDTDGNPVTPGVTFYRQPFTVTATVSKFLQLPTGTIDFLAGSKLLGSVPLAADPTTGQATAAFTLDATNALDAGTYVITANYSGDARYAANTATIAHQVLPASTSVQVTPSATAPVFGEPVSLDVQVTAAPLVAGVPVGTAAVFENGNLIGSAPLDAAGHATVNLVGLALGVHPLQVQYIATTNFTASAASQLITVAPATSMVSLNAAPRAATFGDPVTLTATVGLSGGGTPAGTVEFFNGTSSAGTAPIGAGGKAVLTIPGLAVGKYDFTAKYPGVTGVGSSVSGSVRVSVAPTTSALSLSADPQTNRLGGTLTLLADVTDQNGRPVSVGTVTFQGTGPDGKPIAGLPDAAPVSNGVAVALVTGLGLGDAAFTAVFSGTDSITGSTAEPVSVTTTRATPEFTLTTDAGGTSVPQGRDVRFTATFTPPSGLTAVPTGTATFTDNGTPVATLPLVNGAATFVARLSLGEHTIAASYTGDEVYAPSGGDEFATTVTVFRPPEPFATGTGNGGSDRVEQVNPDGTQRELFAFGPDTNAGVRVATGDLNGDGTPDTAVGTGPGTRARARVLDGATGSPLFDIFPFEDFAGGVYVAVGDANGDNRPDLVITPDQGGGPRVRIFSGNSFGQIADFLGIEDPDFRGGARAAVGDFNGDGMGDVAVAAGFGGGPRVAVWDGRGFAAAGVPPQKLVGDFFVFEPSLRNGVYLAAGDLTGDGRADLVIGAGPGGAPRVLALSGADLVAGKQTPVANFFAGDVNNRGGVPVAVRFYDGDTLGDIVTGSGAGGTQATVYAGNSLSPTGTPTAITTLDNVFDDLTNPNGGVFVG